MMSGSVPDLPSQIDLTAMNGVQSIFTKGTSDPWAASLASNFIDFALWHDNIRYPIAALSDSAAAAEGATVPPFLADLQRRDPGWFVPDVILLNEPRQLSSDLLDEAVTEISAFAVNNAKQVRRFLGLHDSAWIGDQIRSRSASGADHYVFDIRALSTNVRAQEVATRLGIPPERLHYLIDLVLKYLLYSERAAGGYYLTHPIRSKQRYRFLGPSLTTSPAPSRTIPISLGPYLVPLAQKRGQDWLTGALHETRGHLQAEGITSLGDAGAVNRDVLWDLARRLRLPVKVKEYDAVKRTATASSASAGLASLALTGAPLPAVIGLAMSLATTIWSGALPNQLSRVRWTQWILECPLEDEAPPDSD